MPKELIYPLYTSALAALTLLLVPRREIRRLAMFGIFFGAVADVFFIAFIILTKMGEYVSFAPFGAFGLPFFPPVAWTFYFITYLYLLPRNKPWYYLFPAVASIYSIFFANVLQSLGILKWHYGNPVLPWLLIYAPWHAGVTWVYLKISARPAFRPRHHRLLPPPFLEPTRKERAVRIAKPKKAR